MPDLLEPTGLSPADAPDAALSAPSSFQPYDASTMPAIQPVGQLDLTQNAEPVDMPPHAAFIPQDVLDQVQQQDTADSWAQDQLSKVADTWAQIQNGHAMSMVQDALTQARQAMMAPAPQIQSAVQAAPGAALSAATNPLAAGVGVVNALSGQPPAPTPEQAAQQGIISPGEATAANLMGGIAAGGPESLGGPAAAATDLAGAGASALGRAIQTVATSPDTLESIGRLGIPAIAGGSEDFLPIAREALTADHPLVQMAAQNANVDPAAVARVLQSPGFDPVAIAKNPARAGNTKVAALVTWQGANDATIVNALDAAAAQATGKPVAALTADDEWNSIPGLGMHASANALPPTPSVTEPDIANLAQAGAGRLPPPGEAPAGGGANFGDLYQQVVRGLVRAKLMNPLIHIPNVLSESAEVALNPAAWRNGNPFAAASALMKNPDALAQTLNEAPRLNLAGATSTGSDLYAAREAALNKVPVVGGIRQAMSKVTDPLDRVLFGTVVRKNQLAAYSAGRAMGMDADTASLYANAKMGQIPRGEVNDATNWIAQNVALAGRWLEGTAIQLGSLVGHPELLTGYGSNLTRAQQVQLANALRGDFLRGVGTLAASHTAINYALSGHGPWQNEPGRWLDIDTGQKDAQGKAIYLTDPFFRRVQDAVHVLGAVPVPGNPLVRGTGTTSTSALVNKVNPVLQTGVDILSGSQYQTASDQPPGLQGGPPIIAPGATLPDALKQGLAFAYNQAAPGFLPQVRSGADTRSPEGIKLAQPGVTFSAGPGNSPVAAPLAIAGSLTGLNATAGGRDIGTQAEYFANQDEQAYGADTVKPFHDAGVQLSTMPNTVSQGVGSAKKSIPTTAADRPAFQAAYGAALQKGLQQNQKRLDSLPPSQRKGVLTTIESKAFTAGRDAVLKGMTQTEIQRRIGVADTGAGTSPSPRPSGQATLTSDAWASALGRTPQQAARPAASPAASAASTTGGGLTAASWAKALGR